MNLKSRQQKRRIVAGSLAGISLVACMVSGAQTAPAVDAQEAGRASAPVLFAVDVLPDAPSTAGLSSSLAIVANGRASLKMEAAQRDNVSGSSGTLPEASRTQKFIQVGQTAPQLTARETVVLGLKDTFSLITIAGWFTSAGYEQLTNSSPNYGTDRGAFGERLGAAAICNSSEDLLTESVMAPLLHEDPRYYRMGPKHNFFQRLVYAGTRPLVTRTNSGHLTPNFAAILGNAEGSALTNAYYPQVNRGAEQTMETLGFSIGGSAIGDVIGEFYGDVLKAFHIGHP